MLVCNAVMLFAELDRQDSPAQRLLLYPKKWDVEMEGADKKQETSIRLLQKAALQYSVTLLPVDPVHRIDNDSGKQNYPSRQTCPED